MKGVLALLAILLLASANSSAQQYCAVRVETAHRILSIEGSSCSENLDAFWQSVERELPKPLPSNLRTIALKSYGSPDLLEAMARSFGSACKSKSFQSAAFVEKFGELPEAKVLAPTLIRLRPILDSADNYYVLRLSSRGVAIRSPGCKYELLPPILYYRLLGPGT